MNTTAEHIAVCQEIVSSVNSADHIRNRASTYEEYLQLVESMRQLMYMPYIPHLSAEESQTINGIMQPLSETEYLQILA